jgi:hypothetical protein
MADVILQQDLVSVILALKEHNVKVSLIRKCFLVWFILHSSILGISCPGNSEAVCNGNGQCDLTTGSCICDTGFEGTQCEG